MGYSPLVPPGGLLGLTHSVQGAREPPHRAPVLRVCLHRANEETSREIVVASGKGDEPQLAKCQRIVGL
jgi:hypothetical protein